MNKKVVVIASIVMGVLLVGGVAAYTKDQNDKKEQDKMAMQKKADEEAMLKKQQDASMQKDAMAKSDGAMAAHGNYVSLADYTANTSKYADSKRVYFFHASWCPICKAIDQEVTADMSKLPVGVTLIKTDFDSATDLRKQYGVTTQYTFVQVDGNGTQVAKWSATSLSDAVAGMKL